MNPKIWQLIKDYMTRGKGERWREISELEPWMEDALRKEQEGMEAAMQEGMVDEDAYNDVIADLVSLDEHELMLDHYGIYQKDDPVYARAANERVALYKRLDDLGKEKKKTKKLKKSSKGIAGMAGVVAQYQWMY